MRKLAVWCLVTGVLWVAVGCTPRAIEKPTDDQATNGDRELAPLPFAARLPADARVYARLDPDRVLSELDVYLRFVDQDLGKEMAIQANKGWAALIQMAANRDFKPRLAQSLFRTRMHLVLLLQAESPIDPEDGGADKKKVSPGVDLLPLMGPDRCLSLVLEVEPGIADDFIEQLKGELERQDSNQGNREYAWTEVDLDAGYLIRLDYSGLTIGRIDGYLIISDAVPRRLWTAIRTPAARSLVDTDRYGRFSSSDPSWFAVVDLSSLGEDLRRGLEKEHKQMLDRFAELPAAEVSAARESTEAMFQTMLLVQRLLSLDKLRAAGARMDFSASQDHIRYGIQSGFVHDLPLSRVMQLVFDGGRSFKLPAAGLGDGLAVMWRLDLAGVYAEVVEQLTLDYRQKLLTVDTMIRGTIGYAIQDLIQLLSGDLYYFLGLAGDRFGDELPLGAEGAGPAAKGKDPEAWNLVLLGIADAQATARALDKIYEALAAIPSVASWLERRDYQGSQITLIGPATGEGERDPGSSVAMAQLKNHLVFGNWEAVTDLVRHRTTASVDDSLARLIDKHPQSRFLLVVSQKLLERFEKHLEQSGQEPTFDQLIAELKGLDLAGDGQSGTVEPAEEDLRKALIRLLEIGRDLSPRMSGFLDPALVMRSQHAGRQLEVILEADLRRR